jgi:hypothetical protein
MAMEKFANVWGFDSRGRRVEYLNVGIDRETGELFNPYGYDVTDLRRAIAAYQEKLDQRYRERREASPTRRRDDWNDRRS